jgi:hypothetical protein
VRRREAGHGGQAREAHVVVARAHRVVEQLVREMVVLREELLWGGGASWW